MFPLLLKPNRNKLILDEISGAIGAYSLRKINSKILSAIRVRRDNDNVETDIGFSGNRLDLFTLSTFVGANSAYIKTWYDQSGNGRDVTQTNTTKQPRIINAGVLDVDSKGNPVLVFDGSNDELICSPISTISGNLCTMFAVFKQLSVANVSGRIIGFDGNGGQAHIMHNGSSGLAGLGASSPVDARVFPSINMSTQKILSFTRAAINSVIAYENGIQPGVNGSNTISCASNDPTRIFIGSSVGGNYSNIQLSEAIIMSPLSLLQKNKIEKNQGKYYGINVA